MSRVGKKPIIIPEGVEVKINDNTVIIKGPKGELQKEVRPEIKVEVKDYYPPSTRGALREGGEGVGVHAEGVAPRKIFVIPQIETKKTKAFWGLTRALIYNMIKGVTEGYEKKLEIEGIGFRAVLEDKDLALHVGFSHAVKIKAPEGINFSVEKNIITVSGFDKESVSQTAANIRKVKKPEPYKGKGIRYLGEVIRKKVGKKAVTAAK